MQYQINHKAETIFFSSYISNLKWHQSANRELLEDIRFLFLKTKFCCHWFNVHLNFERMLGVLLYNYFPIHNSKQKNNIIVTLSKP